MNVRVDGRHLGTKKRNLARVHHEQVIAKLYHEREKKDLLRWQKKANRMSAAAPAR